MAITTYAELKTAVAAWADRTDLTTPIIDFVTLTEATINNGDAVNDIDPLRVREMETSASVSVTSGVGTLPTGFLEARRVYSATSNRVLEYAPPEWYLDSFPSGDGGYPTFYTIIGTDIHVSSDVTMIYYKALPALSDSTTSNWLLTKAPNVYLFGALYYLEIYAMNPEGGAARRSLFRNALAGIANADIFHRGGSFARRSSAIAQ